MRYEEENYTINISNSILSVRAACNSKKTDDLDIDETGTSTIIEEGKENINDEVSSEEIVNDKEFKDEYSEMKIKKNVLGQSTEDFMEVSAPTIITYQSC